MIKGNPERRGEARREKERVGGSLGYTMRACLKSEQINKQFEIQKIHANLSVCHLGLACGGRV